MRLDEWQKFIESQFLEETAAEKPPVKPAAVPKTEPQTSLFLDDDPIAIAISEEKTSEVPEANLSPLITPIVEQSSAEAPTERPQPWPTPTQTTQRQTGFVVKSVVETEADRPELLPSVSPVPLDEPLEIDADIPIFANYLPSKSAESTEPTPAPSEASVVEKLLEDAPVAGPVSVLLPLTSGFASMQIAPGRKAGPTSDSGTADRRRKRAPQARNVPSENVASALSSADLWAKVPRHVQTLLALERREEEKEVAQSSYKRPFQEKRAELIARILDPVLSLEDTARLLNVCPTTVRRYTNKGILTHHRKETERQTENTSERETRQRRFRLSDILTFLETQQSALEADRLQERVAPSRRKRTTPSLDAPDQE